VVNSFEENGLHEAMSRVLARHHKRDKIIPTWLATETMIEIEFPVSLHGLGYLGCHLHLREIARAFCRESFDPIYPRDGSADLFPDTLQARYPRARLRSSSDEPEYVLPENMSDADIQFNVDRLRQEATAKLKHADALEEFGRRGVKPDVA
jgi:hypothetical protein